MSLIETFVVSNGHSKLILTGNLNLNVCEENPSNNVNDYVNLLTSYGLQNTINLPTRICDRTGNDTSCLDHFWHNLSVPHSSYVISPSISDHYYIATIFDATLHRPPVTLKFRNYSDANVERFLSNMHIEFQECDPPSEDVHTYA